MQDVQWLTRICAASKPETNGLGRMTLAHDKAVATTTDDYIVRYWYRSSGRRQSAVRGAGTIGFATNYYYDAALRLSTLANTLPFPGAGLVLDLAYNPAGQIVRYVRSNDSYAWRGAYTVSRPYAANGLNQYSAAGSAAFLYDPNGNLIRETTPAATRNYVYDVENRLVSASGAASASLVYDPLGRLFQTSGGTAGVRQFLYDGDALVAEYNGTGTLLKRYVHGPGADEPVAQYDGTALGLSSRRYTLPDERGSIAALVHADGSPSVINTYDEYGIPGAANDGRFQYTGQVWLPELGMYYYKARIYSPTLGRFLQTDPIGYEDQVNLYAYVGNDPINGSDPTGECDESAKVGICGHTAEEKAFIELRIGDKTSEISQTEEAAVKANQLVDFNFASTAINLKTGQEVQVDGGDTQVADLSDGTRRITVTIDVNDRVEVSGTKMGRPAAEVESKEVVAEHEIASHVRDAVVRREPSETRAVGKENEYRQRNHNSFKRTLEWIRVKRGRMP